jgi:DNA-binding transcriptional ArsR family regulator
MTPSEQLDATFIALADPTRRAILARLTSGEASVNELAEPFSISQPAVSKHLKILERAGLVTRSRDATRRPVKIEAAPMREAADWLANYRKFWEQSYQRLDALLEVLQTPVNKPDTLQSKKQSDDNA